MSIKLHPESFEQAFYLGETTVRFFFQSEFCWIRNSDPDAPVPEIVDTYRGQLRALVEGLRRTIPPRSRLRLCDDLLSKLDRAWGEYRGTWGSDAHRDAMAAISDVSPEQCFDVEQDVLKYAPVTSESFRSLRKSTTELVGSLSPVLRTLAKIGELIAKAYYWSATDRDVETRNSVSPLCYVTVNIDRQLRAELREIRKQLPELRGIPFSLKNAEFNEALTRLSALRDRILISLGEHASRCETETPNGEKKPLQPCQLKALHSFEYAVSRMPKISRVNAKNVWNWLKEHSSDEYTPPKYPTWLHYLSVANRNPPERLSDGKPGRSVISSEEAYTQRREREKD